MKVSLIAAATKNGVIGRENKLPWKLPTDMQFFKTQTKGKPVICGRKTFESIGRALPGRKMVIVTTQQGYNAPPGCVVADSLENALFRCLFDKDAEVYVIGGAQLYKQALSVAHTIYLTEIDVELDGDAFFPEFSKEEWNAASTTEWQQGANDDYPVRFIRYEKTI